MNEDKIPSEHYLAATVEFEHSKLNEALWSKSMAVADGDESKARYIYIRERANQLSVKTPREQSFTYWRFYGYFGLIFGTLGIAYSMYQLAGFDPTLEDSISVLALVLIVFNAVVMIRVLQFSRVAFLIATIISLNPLIWVINGVYLRNRWENPTIGDIKQNRRSQEKQDSSEHYALSAVGKKSSVEPTWRPAEDIGSLIDEVPDDLADALSESALLMHFAGRPGYQQKGYSSAFKKCRTKEKRQVLFRKIKDELENGSLYFGQFFSR